MKSKGLLTASFLLLLLTGVLWWSNKRAAKADKEPIESTTTKLVGIPEDQLQEIEIKRRSGETVRLQRNDSKWQITAPKSLPADADAVSSMLSTLSSLSSDRTIEDKATSLEQYGLTQPAIELDITEKNKKTSKLLVGDDTPAGIAVYAAIAGDPRVFALSTYKKSSLDKSTNDLRDKRLLTFDSDKVSSIELTAKKQTIVFGRSKDEWQIVKPKPFRARSEEHTSELQSQSNLVCRLLLEKKKTARHHTQLDHNNRQSRCQLYTYKSHGELRTLLPLRILSRPVICRPDARCHACTEVVDA